MATAAPGQQARTKGLSAEAVNEPRFVFHGVTWSEYESVLRWVGDRRIPVTYDRGTLEIMSPLPRHELYEVLLSSMIEMLVDQYELPSEGLGSTTFRREDLEKGLEPDSCYYIKHFEQARGREELDLRVDPPPDLVVEMDITSSSIDRLGIYVALGVPEVWHVKNQGLRYLRLRGETYSVSSRSASFPRFTAAALTEWLARGVGADQTAWRKAFRAWVRAAVAKDAKGRTGKRK
jgi:Uma2 family endonuclease